ncbi:CobW family GTP-binding protein [Lysinibacillus sp. NPDC056232]|uniref:CobW family GTP-binding protein n=1 Tax=Lysinibacillus sp. NPDC056232 TaxID=3345756 RepID=UPI0035D8ABDC
MGKGSKIPISIITGCLGSGKTTLIQEVLNHKNFNEDVAIIVNEFGEVGLDHHLLKLVEEKTKLLNGGCICCNSREDLEQELIEILNAYERDTLFIDRLLIETTGLADPSPMLFTLVNNPILQNRFNIDCVIMTIDAINGELQFKNNPEIYKQLAVADKVVITKHEMNPKVDVLIKKIQTLNPASTISLFSDIDETLFIGENFSNYAIEEIKLSTPQNHYSAEIQSISFSFTKPLNWTAFGIWLSMLLYAEGESILRVKGILDVGETGPIILNGVQHIIHPPQHLNEWPDQIKYSHIVFIVRGIDIKQLESSLLAFQNFLGTEVAI